MRRTSSRRTPALSSKSRACSRSSTRLRPSRTPKPISRGLSAYAGQLDGETGRLKIAGSQGVIAPDFILDKTLAQLRLARSGNVSDWPLVASFERKTQGLTGDFAAQAAKIATQQVGPGARSPACRARGASQAGDSGRRRLEVAAGRSVLRLGAARGDHHAHDAGRNPRSRAGRSSPSSRPRWIPS